MEDKILIISDLEKKAKTFFQVGKVESGMSLTSWLRRAFSMVMLAGAWLNLSAAEHEVSGRIEVARNGGAVCVIAVAPELSRFERKAADDLKEYLEKITGAEFEVLPEAEAGGRAAIYLGQTGYATANGVDFSGFGKEEWVLKHVGGNLIVGGGRPIGTFYGVWALLEKAGVWALSMEETVVPSVPSLVFADVGERKKPCFAGRVIYDKFPIYGAITGLPQKWRNAYDMWLLRSRINGGQNNIWMPLYRGDMFNISHKPEYHTFSLYVDPDKYFSTNPEYFSMDDRGRRFRPRGKTAGGSLCLTNENVKKITLKSLRKMILADRKRLPVDEWPVIYDISTLDLIPFLCECPSCKAISDEEGSESGLLLRFINQIATEIAAEYPEINIRTFIYGPTRNPPRITRPVANVLLQVCDLFVACDYFRPLSSEFNAPAKKFFDDWHRTGARLVVWDYWNMMMYFNPPRLETVTDTIQPDLRYFAEIGTESMFIESEKHFFKPQNFMDMNYFLASRLMVDPDQDAEALIDIFLEGFYGAAAPELRQFLNQLREGVSRHPTIQTGMRVVAWNFMTPQFILDTYRLLKSAAAKVPSGSNYQRRVHDEMIPLLWLVIEKQSMYFSVFEEAGISLDSLKNECRFYCLAHMERFGSTKLDVDSPHVPSRRVFELEFNRIVSTRLPRPEKFRDIPDEDIRVLGKYHFFPKPNYHTLMVEDSDSPTGFALRGASPDPAKHGTKTFYRDPSGKFQFRATQFGCANGSLVIEDMPQDEKYHWYKIPNVTLTEKSWFWGHIWYLAIPLSSVYMADDGTSDTNRWDCWFSAKFTGPAYVKHSRQQNAIWIDMVVLTRPDNK